MPQLDPSPQPAAPSPQSTRAARPTRTADAAPGASFPGHLEHALSPQTAASAPPDSATSTESPDPAQPDAGKSAVAASIPTDPPLANLIPAAPAANLNPALPASPTSAVAAETKTTAQDRSATPDGPRANTNPDPSLTTPAPAVAPAVVPGAIPTPAAPNPPANPAQLATGPTPPPPALDPATASTVKSNDPAPVSKGARPKKSADASPSDTANPARTSPAPDQLAALAALVPPPPANPSVKPAASGSAAPATPIQAPALRPTPLATGDDPTQSLPSATSRQLDSRETARLASAASDPAAASPASASDPANPASEPSALTPGSASPAALHAGVPQPDQLAASASPTPLSAGPASVATPAPPPPAQQVAQALADPVRVVLAAPSHQSAAAHVTTIQLQPADLGRVEIRIERAADGPAKIDLAAERPETLLRLIHDQPQLQQALDQAGIPQHGRTISFSLGAHNGATGGAFTNFAGNSPSSGGFQRPQQAYPNQTAPDLETGDAIAPVRAWRRTGIDITA